MDGVGMAEADDILAEGKKLFSLAESTENDNRVAADEDIRFARNEEQWPEAIRRQREREERPCLTISKMNAFIRQVVNDARQNKPAIKVHPADSGADPDTADVINGLIRNIEYTSNADTAYDTAVECAVSGGFGYVRVGLDYAYHDSFDMDLQIKRVANPFSVYGDPNSVEADSSDWNNAFVVERLTEDQFNAKYKGKSKVDWDDTTAWGDESWREANEVMVAEWWTRTEEDVKVYLTTDGKVFSQDQIDKDTDVQALIERGVIEFARDRIAKKMKVRQRIMSGAEILEDNDWAGCYIPIIPVYGDEYNIKGRRYFRSLIHSAKDAQRQFNYWRSTATELVALAPRVPWIGPKGSFDHDQDRWNTANKQSHAYLEYDDKGTPPTRIPLDSGPAAGALQEALNASDDMKAVIGLYDASLGARSNETSGRAIMARQREGDVSTFHFVDNMSRAIRHTGRVLIDLIPHVYTGERIVRVMGEDGTPEKRQLGKEYPKTDPKTGEPLQDEMGQAIMALHDLSAGKYDLTVTTGPSFTTRREEAAYQMTEMMRALPASAPILGKHLAKNLDWPGADEIAEELEAMSGGPQIPPEVQQAIEEGKQIIAKLQEENQQLKGDRSMEEAKLAADMQKAQLEAQHKMQIAQAELQSKEQLAAIEIESEERIAQLRIASEARIAAERNRIAAAARPLGRQAG
jgi:hypothetical protein